MQKKNASSIGQRVLAALCACAAAGCASNAPYHSTGRDGTNCRSAPSSEECLGSVYQDFSSHDIAFAEFSERGNAFSDQAIATVLGKIKKQADAQGVVLIVFIHGWKHNASETDGNVLDFKDAMLTMSGILKKAFDGTELGSRRLVGLYVGWRGASITLPILEELTFWDRKAVAEELGSGGITHLLLDLDRITAGAANNVMVVVGHSFGGAIVVRAMADVLTERVTNRGPDGRARTFGDGVLVLNPAVEANQALPIIEAALQPPYKPNQLPLFISLSSDADWPTHHAFPAGQTLGLATWKQADLQRAYYRDRQAPGDPLPLRERHLDATTVGNFAPFLTHRLHGQGQGDALSFSLTPCADAAEGCRPMGWTTLTGQPTIGPLPTNYPLYFIKTDASVMTGHNDIFNPKVRSFVFTVIDDVVRSALRESRTTARDGDTKLRPRDTDKALRATEDAPGASEPPLIASPKRFTDRMNELWKQQQAGKPL